MRAATTSAAFAFSLVLASTLARPHVREGNYANTTRMLSIEEEEAGSSFGDAEVDPARFGLGPSHPSVRRLLEYRVSNATAEQWTGEMWPGHEDALKRTIWATYAPQIQKEIRDHTQEVFQLPDRRKRRASGVEELDPADFWGRAMAHFTNRPKLVRGHTR